MEIDYIKIHEPEISDNVLKSRISVPNKLRKVIKSDKLFVEYDENITSDKSILNIPIISEVIALAWLTNTNIVVESLDKNYKESMDELKQIFKKMYPRSTMNCDIIVDRLVENTINNVGTAQLFSGGVDSAYTTITNMELKPRLVMIWGVEGQPYPLNPEYWEKNIEFNHDFATDKNLDFNVIKTNIRDIVYERRVEHDFHNILYDGHLWLRISFPLVLLGILAPLSIGRFNRLLIASGLDPSYDFLKNPHSSQPEVDEKLFWADLKISHDGYIHRFTKISGKLKEYMKENELILRVCLSQQEKANCSKCEKCFRTIAPLVLSGIDPNNHGFEVSEETFSLMKRAFEAQKIGGLVLEAYWRDLQKIIPKNIEENICGSKQFFEWYKKFELKEKKNNKLYDKIYYNLPFELVPLLDIFLIIPYKIKSLFMK